MRGLFRFYKSFVTKKRAGEKMVKSPVAQSYARMRKRISIIFKRGKSKLNSEQQEQMLLAIS